MLAQQFLEASAARRPDSIALICGEERLSYTELDLAANRFARMLREHGIRRGDRVALLLDNSVEAVVAIFGILKAGAVFSVLHPACKRDKLASLLQSAEPAALVTESHRVREATDVLGACGSLAAVVWADDSPLPVDGSATSLKWCDLEKYPSERPGCQAIDVDLATLIYTSGTTGEPKGVMVTHANIVAATRMTIDYLHYTQDDVILCVLPLAHSYGLYQIFEAFLLGGRVVLEKNFAFPARAIGLLEHEGVTVFPGSPTIYALLLKYRNLLQRPLPSLHTLTNAASALPTSHIAQLRDMFPNVRIVSMYGQTECKRVCYLPADELDTHPDSVGVAIPNSEVYIVDQDGQRLGPGETGELVVRGSHVARGYWRAPELTAQRFRPGPTPGEIVLHTGDLFRVDAQGLLYFISRKDDIIKSRGEKVSPLEVENVVCQLPGVAEAAVVGVPDSVLGQAVLVAVTLQEQAHVTERDIRAHCARHLEDFMQPKFVDIVADLPRTDNGKVNKRAIAAEFASLCAAS